MNPEARENFRRQAEWCARLGSPFTALVCKVLHERLTEGSAFGARLLNWPGEPEADAIALRACGALNFFARAGHPALAPLYPPHPLPSEEEYWRGAEVAIRDLDDRLTRFLDSAPQTNEVARSAALLPGYLGIVEPHRPAAVDPRDRRERGTEPRVRPLRLRLRRVRVGAARRPGEDLVRMARPGRALGRQYRGRRPARLRHPSDRCARRGGSGADAGLHLARPGRPSGPRRGRLGTRRAARSPCGGDRRRAVRGARAARRRFRNRAGARAHDLLAISAGGRPRPPSAPRSPRRRVARPRRARSRGCASKPKPRSVAARCCASRSGPTDRSTKSSRSRAFTASGSSGGRRGLRREIRASSSGRKIWQFAKSPAHVK